MNTIKIDFNPDRWPYNDNSLEIAREAMAKWREENPFGPEYRPTCRVENHTFRLEIDGGGMYLTCIDPCPKEHIMQMNGSMPGCEIETDYISAEINNLKFKTIEDSDWETGYTEYYVVPSSGELHINE